MAVERIRGVIAPLLTPFNDDLSIATDLYVTHAHWLFEQGCAGIAPFGTTGEALSVGIDERIAAIRVLAESGIDPARMIPGTGLSNVADTARLSRACLDVGCAGVMTLPPFYYKGVPEEGLYRNFSEIIQRVGDDRLRIYLYHIPPVAQVGIPLGLIERLLKDYPGIVAGAMMAFTLSLDDFVISFFTAGPESQTLPLFIFAAVRRGVTPQIHALSTLIMLVSAFAGYGQIMAAYRHAVSKRYRFFSYGDAMFITRNPAAAGPEDV